MTDIPNAASQSEEEDNDIIFDLESRRIDIFCKVDRRAALHMQTIIEELKNTGKKETPVTVVVNTEGGLAFQGLAIYDLMRSSGLKFRTIVLGEVASAGLVIALAGKERWMHKHASLKFHATAMQFAEPQKALEQYDEDVQRGWKNVVNKLYDEITIANSRLTAKQIHKLERQQICLTAEQALELGLVHKIIG
ncbi:MAG: ATP-dependent Clp protease proteolytic subunit [Candidatus Yanofskybacteria bacterium]|nr:ATP-dependent Clp protease proteolytic subunit [Candidatus Yanofskybacteria bacterium]